MSEKIYIREWFYSDYKLQPKARFINTGVWADGRLAYSMIDENGEILPKMEDVFFQTRFCGKLVMEHA